MKKPGLFALLILFLISGVSFGQHSNKIFKMERGHPLSIAVDQSSTKSVELFPYVKNEGKSYGLNAGSNIGQNGGKSTSGTYLFLVPNNLTFKFSEY